MGNSTTVRHATITQTTLFTVAVCSHKNIVIGRAQQSSHLTRKMPRSMHMCVDEKGTTLEVGHDGIVVAIEHVEIGLHSTQWQ